MDEGFASLKSLFVLFDFDDQDCGVGHVSSIKKPVLPLDEPDDALALVKSWISSQKKITIR